MATEMARLRAFAGSKRAELDGKAIRWASEAGYMDVDGASLRTAITAYLHDLDPWDPEWMDWLDCYGEAKLIHLFEVDI